MTSISTSCGAAGGPSRRERVRSATEAEIKATAREILVRDGAEGLTLRAIARDMGMSAPALYRYFDSHDALLMALCDDLLDELTVVLEKARDAAPDGPQERMGATCRAFRAWALNHPREFQLTFASNVPHAYTAPGEGEDLCAIGFGMVFLEIFQELWARNRFRVPTDEQLTPELVEALRAFAGGFPADLPLGAVAAFLTSWVQLYGAVTVEVFGHLQFAVADAEPLFEQMLRDFAVRFGPAESSE